MKSDTIERVVQSAYSFIEGFYPNDIEFTTDIKYRLPPINHVIKFIGEEVDQNKQVDTENVAVEDAATTYTLNSVKFTNCVFDKLYLTKLN